MPSLDIKDAINILTGLGTLGGVVIAIRVAVARLQEGQVGLERGQAETLRQLGALHKRMDHHGELIRDQQIKTARLEERVDVLRQSQRFRVDEGRS